MLISFMMKIDREAFSILFKLSSSQTISKQLVFHQVNISFDNLISTNRTNKHIGFLHFTNIRSVLSSWISSKITTKANAICGAGKPKTLGLIQNIFDLKRGWNEHLLFSTANPTAISKVEWGRSFDSLFLKI